MTQSYVMQLFTNDISSMMIHFLNCVKSPKMLTKIVDLFSQHVGEKRTIQEILAAASESSETTDDWLLAQMLQQEFDREHDQTLRVEEKKFNGNNKGSLQCSNV